MRGLGIAVVIAIIAIIATFGVRAASASEVPQDHMIVVVPNLDAGFQKLIVNNEQTPQLNFSIGVMYDYADDYKVAVGVRCNEFTPEGFNAYVNMFINSEFAGVGLPSAYDTQGLVNCAMHMAPIEHLSPISNGDELTFVLCYPNATAPVCVDHVLIVEVEDETEPVVLVDNLTLVGDFIPLAPKAAFDQSWGQTFTCDTDCHVASVDLLVKVPSDIDPEVQSIVTIVTPDGVSHVSKVTVADYLDPQGDVYETVVSFYFDVDLDAGLNEFTYTSNTDDGAGFLIILDKAAPYEDGMFVANAVVGVTEYPQYDALFAINTQ